MIIAVIALLAIFVSVGALTAEWFRENAANGGPLFVKTGINPAASGPTTVQLALDKLALTSLFTTQMSTQPGMLSNLSATPGPNDGLAISFNLHIDANGIQRAMPVEINGKVGLDNQQNLQLRVLQLKRDGVVADTNTTATMQNAINHMLASTITSALHTQFKGTKLISVHTSTTITCAQQTEMIVLQVETPAMAGVAGQAALGPFCLKGPVDPKKLLPQ